MNALFEKLGFGPADILLPRDADLTKWAVVACDQFTSQPDYWQAVEDTVGDAPSSLRLILPEAQLRSPEVDRHIAAINGTMADYLDRGVFREVPDALVYVERTQSDGTVRRGLVGRVDLEAYDFTPGSGALIRATEGTVLSRVPPRVRVRRDAPLELPHILLLADDPERTVLEPLAAQTGDMESLYDFDLQQGGGHLAGWRLPPAQMTAVADALAGLITPEAMERKYGLPGAAPLLFAVGDGNHSLAAAKQCWEELKATLPESAWADHPARYALAEVVNSRDEALAVLPIHRVLFDVDPAEVLAALKKAFPGDDGRCVTCVWGTEETCFTVPADQLAAGAVQTVLDAYLADHPHSRVDYIHGDDVARTLGAQPGNLAVLLPAMERRQLFRTVLTEGVLPRKTFSLGHARDKRYYLEARKLK